MNSVQECEYNLKKENFWLLQNILFTFEGEYETRLDDAIKRMKEDEPEAGEIEPGPVRRFGETLSGILSNVRLHVRDCELCRKNYRNYVDGQRRDYRSMNNVFRKAGMKTKIDEIDSLDPDFLGLYVH